MNQDFKQAYKPATFLLHPKLSILCLNLRLNSNSPQSRLLRITCKKVNLFPVPVSHVHLKINSTKSIINDQTRTREHLNYFICALLLLYVGEAFILPIKKACGLRESFPTRKCQLSSTNPWIHLAKTQLHFVYLSLLFGSASLLVLSVNLPDLYLVFHF